jgi:hypothetical protein
MLTPAAGACPKSAPRPPQLPHNACKCGATAQCCRVSRVVRHLNQNRQLELYTSRLIYTRRGSGDTLCTNARKTVQVPPVLSGTHHVGRAVTAGSSHARACSPHGAAASQESRHSTPLRTHTTPYVVKAAARQLRAQGRRAHCRWHRCTPGCQAKTLLLVTRHRQEHQTVCSPTGPRPPCGWLPCCSCCQSATQATQKPCRRLPIQCSRLHACPAGPERPGGHRHTPPAAPALRQATQTVPRWRQAHPQAPCVKPLHAPCCAESTPYTAPPLLSPRAPTSASGQAAYASHFWAVISARSTTRWL